METLFLYFGKVILTSGVLFLYYHLFLKNKTFHHYNRFYLLGIMVISLLLPLLKLSYFTLKVNSDIYLLLNNLQNFNTSKNIGHDFIYFKTGAVFIGLVAFFFLTKLVFGLIKIQQFKKKFKKENFDGITFYQTNLEEAPFSFFKNLFWKDSILMQSDLGRQILKHEMVHIEQKHSLDKIFLELATSLFWFNPFFYLIKKEIHLIHEYLADKKALKNSDTKAFAQMLLASHFSGKQLPATSPFLSSNLKKRLTMLKKSKTKFSYARRILALPLLFSLAFVYLVNAKNKEISSTNLEIEKMISNYKSDTIAPNKNAEQINTKGIAIGTDGTKRYEEHPELFFKNDSIHIENEINSPEFQQRMKDADRRAAEADKIVNSPTFKKRIAEAEKRAAKAEKMVNSPKFKRKIAEAEKRAAEAEKLVNSPEFIKRIADAEKRAAEADKLVNSPEFKKKIEAAERKADEAVKSANIEEKAALQASRTSETAMKNSQVDVYINGKLSTNIEMDKLNPGSIESVNVYKKGFEGKEKGEIQIKLKK